MEKLTIKELAPYLPYGLNIMTEDGKETMALNNQSISHIILYNRINEVKPILRPISYLTKKIKVNGESFIPNKIIQWLFDDGFDFEEYILDGRLNHQRMQKLFEWHFDVFGLIEKGLAIDINTL